MKKYSIKDFFIFEKGSCGVIYYAKTGELKIVEKPKLNTLIPLFNHYESGELSFEEIEQFESFLSANFIKKEKPFFLEDGEGLHSSKRLNRLEIMLSTDCNLRCKYCYADGGSYGQKRAIVSSKNVLSYLQKIIPKHFDDIITVMFFGGEPLLNSKGLENVCNFFSESYKSGLIKRIPTYTVVTNGTLINDKIAKVLKENNVKVTVSIDGDSYFQDNLRPYLNGRQTFTDVYNGINLLREYNVNLVLLEATYTTLHIENGVTRDDLKYTLKKMFGDVEILIGDCIGTSEYALKKTEDSCIDNVSQEYILSALRALSTPKRRDYYCDAGLKSLMISLDGDIYPCHLFFANDNYNFGNVNQKDLFNNESYNRITDSLHGARKSKLFCCNNCSVQEFCTECPASILVQEKNVERGPLTERCSRIFSKVQMGFESVLDKYTTL